MGVSIIWGKKLGGLELDFFNDGELSIAGDVYETLPKHQVKELYLALKDYFENGENK
jgi:hypothetical protein